MTADLRTLIAEAIADSLGAATAAPYDATAGDVLALLAAPESQTPLMDWLAGAGIEFTLVGALVRTGHLKLEVTDPEET